MSKFVVDKELDISKAHEIAQKWHGEQKRENGKDYYSAHLVPVAEGAKMLVRIATYNLSQTEAYIVGLLHDILEDTECPKSVISGNFNGKILSSVENLTKKVGESYADYIERLIESGDKIAMIVKLSDLQHNSSDLNPGSRKDKYEVAYVAVAKALTNR